MRSTWEQTLMLSVSFLPSCFWHAYQQLRFHDLADIPAHYAEGISICAGACPRHHHTTIYLAQLASSSFMKAGHPHHLGDMLHRLTTPFEAGGHPHHLWWERCFGGLIMISEKQPRLACLLFFHRALCKIRRIFCNDLGCFPDACSFARQFND